MYTSPQASQKKDFSQIADFVVQSISILLVLAFLSLRHFIPQKNSVFDGHHFLLLAKGDQ